MHGLQEILFLNLNNRETAARNNARDPGHREQRRAESELATALSHLKAVLASVTPDDCTTCPEKAEGAIGVDRAATGTERTVTAKVPHFPPDFSVIRHGSEAWVLPLTSQGQSIATKIIPVGTPRYGLHYILTGEEGLAIADSILAANNHA